MTENDPKNIQKQITIKFSYSNSFWIKEARHRKILITYVPDINEDCIEKSSNIIEINRS